MKYLGRGFTNRRGWDRITPDNAITELTWRPIVGRERVRELAVASEDASVRIYTVPL